MLADFDMRDNGFDTIRLIAAYAVIVSHAFPLTDTPEPLFELTGQTIGSLAVCIFFMISGYLIPASLIRGTLWRYVVKRARRIMPALIAAVLICAFVLGPLATTLALPAYLASLETWRFVGNILFLPVGYDLPGVFEGHPIEAVNGSLWSLKFEVACYVFVPIAMAIAGFRKLAVIGALAASFVIVQVVDPQGGGGRYHVHMLAYLFQFYGVGMLFFLFADRIPVLNGAAWAALAITVASAFTPFFTQVAAILGSYALIVFAYRSPQWFRKVTASGDISYGVYVYAFPIQQLLVPVTIGFVLGGAEAGWLANAAITLPLVSIAGVASWLLIEKPALTYRRARTVRPSLS